MKWSFIQFAQDLALNKADLQIVVGTGLNWDPYYYAQFDLR